MCWCIAQDYFKMDKVHVQKKVFNLMEKRHKLPDFTDFLVRTKISYMIYPQELFQRNKVYVYRVWSHAQNCFYICFYIPLNAKNNQAIDVQGTFAKKRNNYFWIEEYSRNKSVDGTILEKVTTTGSDTVTVTTTETDYMPCVVSCTKLAFLSKSSLGNNCLVVTQNLQTTV